MFRKIESLIPTFLKKLDRQLLLNRPGLWATKIHYALFFGAIGYALLFFLGAFNGIDLTNVPDTEVAFGLTFIPAGIFFLIWAYRTSLFQVEKGHGQKVAGTSIRDQLVYGLVILMLAAAPVVFSKLIQNKIKRTVPASELAIDVNTLNLGESLFLTDVYEYESLYEHRGNICCNVKYIGYNRYTYYSNHNADIWDEDFIKDQLRDINTKAEKLALLDHFIHTFNKYSEEKIQLTPDEILDGYKAKDWEQRQTQYHNDKHEVVENIWAVQEAHSERNIFTSRNFLPIYLLILTTLWMALQAFFKTNWKLFGGAILAGVATAVVLGITGATLSSVFYMNDDMFFMMIAGSFGFYLVQAFRKKHTHRTKILKNISLILVTVLTPFMPLILMEGFNGYVSNSEVNMLAYLGIGTSILLWNIMYNARFTKLAAQPKEN